MSNIKAYSAPGKALLVGGYLVLDPLYTSYVVALSARMHAIISTCKPKEDRGDIINVTVSSTQFNNDRWSFHLTLENGGYFPTEINGLNNPFLKDVLLNVFNYFKPSIEETPDIAIEIFSDPGYHSQSNSIIKSNEYKHFHFHEESITKVAKTGLGSSAGLVTVVTTALTSLFKLDLDVSSLSDLKIIHNLSQVAHCQAQGKVGSGFDVAAATYGSIIYKRFDPDLITQLPDSSPALIKSYQESLETLINDVNWNIKNDRIRLPKGLRLIMGDVNSGSETTKLVAKVNTWYENNLPESLNIYQKINEGNNKFIQGLSELNKLAESNPQYYNDMLNSLNIEGNSNDYPELLTIRNAVKQIRNNLKRITKESGADIEPDVQTALLDNCLKLGGVLTGMVPGAGGYDAISLITTVNHNFMNETKNNNEFNNVSWLDLKQADFGILQETPSYYSGLK